MDADVFPLPTADRDACSRRAVVLLVAELHHLGSWDGAR
jgi:hypothetical protein